MKAVLLDRSVDEPIDLPRQVFLVADSAIVPAGRPLFLPDFAADWTAKVYIAYRISRLGKSIKARFADRYYDAVTLALRLMPYDTENYGRLAGFFDSCLALGPFHKIDSSEDTVKLSLERATFYHRATDIAEAIESVSSYATLKNGDLILPCYHSLDFRLQPRTDLAGDINGENFRFRIR